MPAELAVTHWVFIRGLVRESAHWDDFADRFAAEIPGACVDPIDLPGNGLYHRMASPLSLKEAVEFVRSELRQRSNCREDALGPVYLFSISLGSMVAVEWMARYPAEIAGAVLVNTSLRRLSPFHQRLSWRAWPEMLRIALVADVSVRERGILELTTTLKSGSEIEALVCKRVEIHRQHPVRGINALRQLIAAARYAPPKFRPSAPILLLGSSGDRLADPRCTEAVAAAWGLAPRIHPAAGHDLPLDDPDWTIRAVREWLYGPADRDRVQSTRGGGSRAASTNFRSGFN